MSKKHKEIYAPKYFARAIISSLIGVSIIIGIAVILNRNHFSKTFDFTTNQINSLDNETIKFLASLNKPVQIICVPSANPLDKYCDTNADLINLYARNSKFIINAGSLSLADKAMVRKVQPSGFSRLILTTETNKSELDGNITESRLTNAIINLVKFKKIVYFLSGSGEPSINAAPAENNETQPPNYAEIAQSLEEKAYEVKEWNIKQGNLPAEARVLVAGDNNIPYSAAAQNMLKNFLARGGKLILVINPYREQGLDDLYAKINLKLDPVLLVLNTKTTLGGQLAKQSYLRPPVIVTNFNTDSPITDTIVQVFGAQAIMPVDGGRPISIVPSSTATSANAAKNAVKTEATVLMTAYSAAPVRLTPAMRNKINLSAPLNLAPEASFDVNKAWPLGVDVVIRNASALNANETPAHLTAPPTAEVVVYGFSLVSPYAISGASPINKELLPLTVAHLYLDQELISIPARDFKPKQFNYSLNPMLWLPIFAALLPLLTAVAGFLIWMRRRKA